MQSIPAAVQQLVERNLPYFENQDLPSLRESIATIEIPPRLADFNAPSGEEGRRFLENNERIRAVVCQKDNRVLINDVVNASNVGTLIALLLPLFSFPPAAVPIAMVALAVAILKRGVAQYCSNYVAS